MKVFISADIEGVSGVVDRDDAIVGGREYERARRLMTADVNAAIAGAYEGGATQVLVNDAHSKMRNLIVEDLDPRAEVIQGVVKRGCMMEGLDECFAAVFFVGYHSRAGNPFGVMNHTMWSRGFQNLFLNGAPVGEIGINAAYAGQFGVPVALVTGDQTAVQEAQELLGPAERPRSPSRRWGALRRACWRPARRRSSPARRRGMRWQGWLISSLTCCPSR